jgi:hypothetical protein
MASSSLDFFLAVFEPAAESDALLNPNQCLFDASSNLLE